MSQSCTEWQPEIGAHVVGALDRRAVAAVNRHLARCIGCRAEYDELVPLRALLDHLARHGRLIERGMR